MAVFTSHPGFGSPARATKVSQNAFRGFTAPQSRRALIVRGILAIAFGLAAIALILQPISGSFAVVWLTGGYGLVFGTLLLAAGLRMKSVSKANALS